MSKELTLPSSVNPTTWNENTAAMMEFAGLTWGHTNNRQYAPAGITAAFLEAVRRTGLDPTARQIYAMQMGGKWTVITGIDGFRVIAIDTGQYDGQDPIEYLDTSGAWTTIPPKKGELVAARARIFRKDLGRPMEFTVTLAEFGGKGPNWNDRPAHMLGIRAESHAFRKAFPQQLSGIYTPEDAEAENVGEMVATPAAPAEPSEDWFGLLDLAMTAADAKEIGNRAHAAGELTGDLRLATMTVIGRLERAEAEVAEEVVEAVPDDVPAE